MSKMSDIAVRLQELENGIADSTWSVDMVTAEINCLMDLGFDFEVENAFNRGINRWYYSGMPKFKTEVRDLVSNDLQDEVTQ